MFDVFDEMVDEDVVSQECGGEAGEKTINFEKLLAEGGMKEAGLYGHVVYVGTYNHIPVISFTNSYTFFEVENVEPEMCGLEWGRLYSEYCNKKYDTTKLAERIQALYADAGVSNRKGIWEYVLSG